MANLSIREMIDDIIIYMALFSSTLAEFNSYELISKNLKLKLDQCFPQYIGSIKELLIQNNININHPLFIGIGKIMPITEEYTDEYCVELREKHLEMKFGFKGQSLEKMDQSLVFMVKHKYFFKKILYDEKAIEEDPHSKELTFIRNRFFGLLSRNLCSRFMFVEFINSLASVNDGDEEKIRESLNQSFLRVNTSTRLHLRQLIFHNEVWEYFPSLPRYGRLISLLILSWTSDATLYFTPLFLIYKVLTFFNIRNDDLFENLPLDKLYIAIFLSFVLPYYYTQTWEFYSSFDRFVEEGSAIFDF